MKPEVAALARHRLSRAREAFQEGEHLLARGGLTGAVNRFYYAAFYAARALLATREVDSSKHSGVISLFHSHVVKAGLMDAAQARALSRAFEKRQKSDYEDFATLVPDEVSSVREEVRAFVDACGQALERLVAEGKE